MAQTAQTEYRHDGEWVDWTPTAALAAGEVIQLPDGRAAVATNAIAAATAGTVQVRGMVEVLKTDAIVFLPGGRVYWDHSANKAHFKTANDRDFYMGITPYGAASAATTLYVQLNENQRNVVSLTESKGGFDTVTVETAGAPNIYNRGGTQRLALDTTAEAQKVDMLSKDAFAVGANAIAEFIIEVTDNGDNAALDINVGVANATHASDADSITESAFVHIDGNTLDIYAESDDGTTEVAATDTTKNFAEGTPFEVWMDMRNPADIQMYIDGVLVLGSTTFDVSAATGPLKLLVHMEKSSDDTPGAIEIDRAAFRLMEE